MHLAKHPDHVVAATDKRSAFQRVSRSEMRRQLVADFPTFLPYFELLYGLEAELQFEGRTVESRHGCQQGCAWGTFLYGHGDRQRMLDLAAAHRNVVFVQFVDDVYMLGAPAAVAAAFSAWRAATEAACEAVNLGKCVAWAPQVVAFRPSKWTPPSSSAFWTRPDSSRRSMSFLTFFRWFLFKPSFHSSRFM